ncbi:MAG: M23 family metallopeptidase [Bacilli bacterium]
MKAIESTLKQRYILTSGFGMRIHPITKVNTFHYGCDYSTYGQSCPIYPLENGIIEKAVKTHKINVGGGRYVIVNYPRLNLKCYYAHCKTVEVCTGQKVDENTILGYVGTTGASTGIHLHLGIGKIGGILNIDPETYNYNKEFQIVGPCNRDYEKNQIEIKTSSLNVRGGAGTNQKILGYAKPGFYNNYEEKQSGSYLWIKIEGNQWVAIVTDYVDMLPVINEEVKKEPPAIKDNIIVDTIIPDTPEINDKQTEDIYTPYNPTKNSINVFLKKIIKSISNLFVEIMKSLKK